ncbi:hypothetical protein FP2506_11352 [Fulvimarina pelagi HTCC2506]|uniref:Uncharacterized protein n=1 Tax=Fulvimarina pelagi HTCC2506 TaxID=314231 RepID=Q0FZ09_9HYPH|nr:hypothetical protein [Fulvimarina pelagi]EAU40149.1 hypothetical protein FP2506_11352 [Fulvimarina pelagi HTCC2506]
MSGYDNNPNRSRPKPGWGEVMLIVAVVIGLIVTVFIVASMFG